MALSNSERQQKHRAKLAQRMLRYEDAFVKIDAELGSRDGPVSTAIRAIIAEARKSGL